MAHGLISGAKKKNVYRVRRSAGRAIQHARKSGVRSCPWHRPRFDPWFFLEHHLRLRAGLRRESHPRHRRESHPRLACKRVCRQPHLWSRLRNHSRFHVKPLSVELFINDTGGYTTVAVAVALLVSLTLVFGVASAGWTQSRSADIQEVADATAMAGVNSVAGFSTVAQVSDACVLSLGITGVVELGAGLVLTAIPLTRGAGAKVLEMGKKVFDMRRDFAKTAAKGLKKFETVLPAIVMANAASCSSANSTDGIGYSGTAIPFPLKSKTDYSFLNDDISGDELSETAEKLQEATERKKEAADKAADAKERAWRADCVDDPKCMRSKASTLASLGGTNNPNYPDATSWKFAYARSRAINYYRARLKHESPLNDSAIEHTRSACRKRYYTYAERVISASTCDESGEVPVIDLPELPRNTDTMKQTSLYTESIWPCTIEEDGRTIHSYSSCSGATGAAAGTVSLSGLDAGNAVVCPVCKMNTVAMGKVGSASTNINSGFEYYWRIVVETAKEYVKAKKDEAEAERDKKNIAKEGMDIFQKVIDQLSVDRPEIKPAGSMGCVAVVWRGANTITPSELTGAFSSGTTLGAGMAISAATLAPEPTTDGSNVLSQVFAGLSSKIDFGVIDGAEWVCSLWGDLLVDYGSAYGTVSGHVNSFLDDIGSVFGEKVASWLKGKISAIVKAAGFEPTDMRARKPVLVHTQQVLDEAGDGRQSVGVAREVLATLSYDGKINARKLASLVASKIGNNGTLTIATLKVPGTSISIPFTIDIKKFVEAL